MYGDYLVWIFVGGVAGIGAVFVGIGANWLTEKLEKRTRRVHVTQRIACASVSKDLMPIVWRLGRELVPFSGSRLVIFGSDGSYLLKPNGNSWQKTIRKWAKKGLKVEYILLDVDDQLRDAYRHMVADHPDMLEVLVLDKTQDPPPLPEVLHDLETCHPTLMIGGNGKCAAWIEGFHERGSEFAYDVHYIAPPDLDPDGGKEDERARFYGYQQLLDYVRGYCKPIAPACHHAAA